MTRKPPVCQICKENEAIWAMQYIASDRASFSSLGSHYRGFVVTKVCDECCDRIRNEERQSSERAS